MAITNPFSITYAGTEVGGDTDYQLHGPYVLDKRHDSLRVVFDVVVVGTSYSNLQENSDTLETAFSARMTAAQTLVISLDGSEWTYTHGTTMLGAMASIAKSGNQETDKGFARAYTVSIEAELPATSDDGLRDVEVLVNFEAGRQRTVSMRGTYTATAAGHAVARYLADFDAEAAAYLTALSGSATYELVDENYTYDRELSSGTPNPHVCNFTRQYVELLVNQSQASLDDTSIRDHRVVFTDLSQHPGDSAESVYRLRRVIGSYDCAIDIDQTTDLQTVFTNTVKPHVLDLFRTNFDPSVLAIEDQRVSYDESNKRLSASIQIIYQSDGGEAIVEVSQSVAFRESRTLDYTPTHEPDEFAADVDVGWATLERVWDRTAIVVGDETPKVRIAEGPKAGDAGLFDIEIGGHRGPDQGSRRPIVREGWNVIASTSQVTDRWVGDPGEEQIKLAVLTETVVERFNRAPGARTSVPIQKAITPR